jgi:hypothetical protein
LFGLAASSHGGGLMIKMLFAYESPIDL